MLQQGGLGFYLESRVPGSKPVSLPAQPPLTEGTSAPTFSVRSMRRSELGLRLRRSVAAGIAQLVEHHLAKVGVAGSSPVSRSDFTGRLRSGGPPRGVWGRIVSQSPPHRRRGQVVRQRTANPLSPVRIRAAPLTRGLITAHEPRTTAASEKPTARITEASAASQVIRAAPRRAKYARRGFF